MIPAISTAENVSIPGSPDGIQMLDTSTPPSDSISQQNSHVVSNDSKASSPDDAQDEGCQSEEDPSTGASNNAVPIGCNQSPDILSDEKDAAFDQKQKTLPNCEAGQGSSPRQAPQDDVGLRSLLDAREQEIHELKEAADRSSQQLHDLQNHLEAAHAKQAELQKQLEDCQKLLSKQQQQQQQQQQEGPSPTPSPPARSVSSGNDHKPAGLDSDAVERMRVRLFKAEKALEAERKMVTMLQRQLTSQHVMKSEGSVSSNTASQPDGSISGASQPTTGGTFEERVKLGGMSMEAALQQHRADQLALQHVRQEKVSLAASLKTTTAEVERLKAQVRAAEDRARTADSVALDAVKSKSAVAAALDKLVAENNHLTDHSNEQARRLADLQSALEQKERENISLRSQLKLAAQSPTHPNLIRLATSIPSSPAASAPSTPHKAASSTPTKQMFAKPPPVCGASGGRAPQLLRLTSNAHDYLLVLAAEMRRLAEILEDEHGASSAVNSGTQDTTALYTSKTYTPITADSNPTSNSTSNPVSKSSSKEDKTQVGTLPPAVLSVLTPAALDALGLLQSVSAINPNWATLSSADFGVDDTLLQLMVLKDEVEELATQVACLPACARAASLDAHSTLEGSTGGVVATGVRDGPPGSSVSGDDTGTTISSTRSNASNHASSSGTGGMGGGTGGIGGGAGGTGGGTGGISGGTGGSTGVHNHAGSGVPSVHVPSMPTSGLNQGFTAPHQNVTSSSAAGGAALTSTSHDAVVDRPGPSKPLSALSVPQDSAAASSSRPSPIVPLISPKDRYGIPYAAPVDKEALEALQALSPVGLTAGSEDACEQQAGYVPIKLTTAPPVPIAAMPDEAKVSSATPNDVGYATGKPFPAEPGTQLEAFEKLPSLKGGMYGGRNGQLTEAAYESSMSNVETTRHEFEFGESGGFLDVSGGSQGGLMAVPVTETMEGRGFGGDIQPLAANSPRPALGVTSRQRPTGFWGWLVGTAA